MENIIREVISRIIGDSSRGIGKCDIEYLVQHEHIVKTIPVEQSHQYHS